MNVHPDKSLLRMFFVIRVVRVQKGVRVINGGLEKQVRRDLGEAKVPDGVKERECVQLRETSRNGHEEVTLWGPVLVVSQGNGNEEGHPDLSSTPPQPITRKKGKCCISFQIKALRLCEGRGLHSKQQEQPEVVMRLPVVVQRDIAVLELGARKEGHQGRHGSKHSTGDILVHNQENYQEAEPAQGSQDAEEHDQPVCQGVQLLENVETFKIKQHDDTPDEQCCRLQGGRWSWGGEGS